MNPLANSVAMRRLALCAVAGLLVGLSGCNTGSRSGPLIPSASSPIADVPVPAGFYLAEGSQSYVSPNGQIRIVNHHYKGKDELLPVVKFYRDQLPTRGWTFVSQNEASGTIFLKFTKNIEDLQVSVHEGTFDTHINIRLDPAGRSMGK